MLSLMGHAIVVKKEKENCRYQVALALGICILFSIIYFIWLDIHQINTTLTLWTRVKHYVPTVTTWPVIKSIMYMAHH
jgi:hypothetical protein